MYELKSEKAKQAVVEIEKAIKALGKEILDYDWIVNEVKGFSNILSDYEMECVYRRIASTHTFHFDRGIMVK